jgi:hydrogenase maturation protease
MESNKSRILVIGLGNPILGDEGVGWNVAEEVKRQLSADLPVDVNCLSLGGLSLMEHLIDYGHVILIDSFPLEEPIGSVLMLKLSDLPNYSAYHVAGTRGTTLQAAIERGRSMGAQLPDDITVIGIATRHVRDFSRTLSTPIKQAVPQAAKFVLGLIDEKIQANKK